MLVRPEGLFPNSRRKMELHAAPADDPQALIATDPITQADEFRSINYNPSDVTDQSGNNDGDKDIRA